MYIRWSFWSPFDKHFWKTAHSDSEISIVIMCLGKKKYLIFNEILTFLFYKIWNVSKNKENIQNYYSDLIRTNLLFPYITCVKKIELTKKQESSESPHALWNYLSFETSEILWNLMKLWERKIMLLLYTSLQKTNFAEVHLPTQKIS